MSNTSTTPITLTPEESEEIDAFAEWASANASTVAASNEWNDATTHEERMTFLRSLSAFDRFREWLQGIADAARRRLLELKMLDMLMAAILELITGPVGAGA
jgi:hypothetical protein